MGMKMQVQVQCPSDLAVVRTALLQREPWPGVRAEMELGTQHGPRP